MANNTSHIEYGEQLFTTSMFSDCTIHCQGRSWKLHRTIIVPRCQFFRACLTSGFQESIPQMNRGISIHMDDDEPEALDRLLRWIYTLTYPTLMDTEDLESEAGDTPQTIPANFWTSELNLCIIADKYNMESLLIEAAYSMLDVARACVSDPVSSKHDEAFTSCLDDFVDMLEVLFTDASLASLPCDLQVELLEITGEMIAKHIGQQGRLSALMRDVPSFGITLVQVLGGSASESDSMDETSMTPSQISTAVHSTPSHQRTKERRRRTSSNGSRGSSLSDLETTIRKRRLEGESKKARGRRQPDVVVVKPVHIPMNEDSDLD